MLVSKYCSVNGLTTLKPNGLFAILAKTFFKNQSFINKRIINILLL